MSYILDALKKSEKERNQGEVPTLNTIQETPPPPRSANRSFAYLLVGILIAVIAVANLWALLRRTPTPTSTQTGQVTPIASPATKGVPVEAINHPDTALAATLSTEATAGKSVPLSDQEMTGSTAATTILSAEQEIAESGEAIEIVEASRTRQSGLEEVSSRQDIVSGKETEPEDNATEKSFLPASEPPIEQDFETADAVDQFESGFDEQPFEDTRKEVKKVTVAYNDLPSNIRNSLPELSIAAHYYSNTPSARMASINGRIMRQGQKITEDLTLEEIDDEGIICSFDKYRFSLKVFNP